MADHNDTELSETQKRHLAQRPYARQNSRPGAYDYSQDAESRRIGARNACILDYLDSIEIVKTVSP